MPGPVYLNVRDRLGVTGPVNWDGWVLLKIQGLVSLDLRKTWEYQLGKLGYKAPLGYTTVCKLGCAGRLRNATPCKL